jgi:RNA polymerase sigma factor (sigma-70 family)
LFVAVVLGTALSAFAPASSPAQAPAQPATQAVAEMSRYCATCWRNARLPIDLWQDCTQEVFARMLERVEPGSWTEILGQEGEERKEFLRAIDTVKKRCQRSRKWTPGLVEQEADPRTAVDRVHAEDWDAVRHTADRVLTERQRQILRLSRDGWSVHEIADELQVGPERVSDEKYKAIRKLRESLT